MSFLGDIFSGIGGFVSDNAGSLIQVGGSLLAADVASSAAERAASAQTAASGEAVSEQARQFDLTQANLAPFIDAGTRGIVQQQALTGLLGPEVQQQAFTDFAASPGQDFLRSEQEKALLRNASAIGGLGGGNVRTALQEQAANRALLDFNNQLNRLAGISGTGQTSAQQLGQIGATTAANTGNLLVSQGQATASGILGTGAANTSLIGNLTQTAGGAF